MRWRKRIKPKQRSCFVSPLNNAQFNLGVMYETGQGVPEDKAEATKWIRKAAEQGDEDAKAWLGKNTKENRE